MAISLQKGGNVNLSKEAPGMKKMLVGLGWNIRATDGGGARPQTATCITAASAYTSVHGPCVMSGISAYCSMGA